MRVKWVDARVMAGIGIVVGLLGLVATSWWARGIGDATALFQLVQGVMLATLGWLCGSQGLERAETMTRVERAEKDEAERFGESLEAKAAQLERKILQLQADLAAERGHNLESAEGGIEG